tara:strand:+ start:952 stop:1146 length:195 start_codon:yes stop_codon:yes gene_type:complete
MTNNYLNKMISSAIDSMQTTDWDWPDGWAESDKKRFLNDCLNWLEQNELYERCEIIKDVQKQLQ